MNKINKLVISESVFQLSLQDYFISYSKRFVAIQINDLKTIDFIK